MKSPKQNKKPKNKELGGNKSEQLKIADKENSKEITQFSEEQKQIITEAINEVKKQGEVKGKPKKINKGVDAEIEDEEIGEEIEQHGHPELSIENQHRPAFNYITELIERKEHKTEDGRIIVLTTKFCVSDRALGKTINGNIKLLYNVSTQDNYRAAIIARNWNENASQTKPYFEDLIRQFIWDFWNIDEKTPEEAEAIRKKWFLDWRPLYRGIIYDGVEVIKFIDLFNPSSAKKRVAQPLTDLIFDEFIPSKAEREEGKGYQPNELKRYSDVEKSCRRKNPHINKVFFGNPNDPYWNIQYLSNFYDYLEEKERQYWRDRPDNEHEYNEWTWHYEKVIEFKEGKGQLLTLKKMKGDENYEFDNYEAFNWDIFYAKRENLGIRKWTNGWEPVSIFNGLAQYYDTTNGEYIFVNLDWLRRFKPHHFKDFDNREEIIVDDYTFINSTKPPHLKTEIEKVKHIQELKDDHDGGQLKFLELETKQKIKDYIASGRTKPKKGDQKNDWET